jgi:hypothetical protein
MSFVDQFSGAKENRFIRPSLSIELKVNKFKYDHEYLSGPAYYEIPPLRVYTHEVIHFWQTLSQGYLANLALSEWKNMIEYEKTKEVYKPGSVKKRYFDRDSDFGFSSYDLVEAQARYWDIHILGAKKLLEWRVRKNINKKQFRTGRVKNIKSGVIPTKSEDFDLMIKSDEGYSRTYRMLLEKIGTQASVILFPIIGYFSLQSPRPVRVYKRVLEKLVKLDIKYNVSIHEGWRMYFDRIMEMCAETSFKTTGSLLTSAHDVISRSDLRNNVLYAHYLVLLRIFMATSAINSDFVFALPGDPENRGKLLGAFQPPLVVFIDGFWVRKKTLLEELISKNPEVEMLNPKKLAHQALDINTRYKKYLRAKLLHKYSK